MISRVISSLIAIFFIVTTYFSVGADDAWKAGIEMIFILALVWFGDEMGNYIGFSGRGYITTTTPGWMLRWFGWIVLIGLFIISLIQFIIIIHQQAE